MGQVDIPENHGMAGAGRPDVSTDALWAVAERLYDGKWYPWLGNTASGSSAYPPMMWIPLVDGLRDFDREPEAMTEDERAVCLWLDIVSPDDTPDESPHRQGL